jgi:phosphomannomutase / phosphoglucomutase
MKVHIPSHIFREYDVRGIAAKDLSPALAECMGRAYMKMLPENKTNQKTRISVGRDCRLTSDAFAEALITGLKTAGAHVIDLGICPSPVTYFSVFNLNLDGGIMITGSHNPSDYNGFKIGVGKTTIHGKQIQELKQLIEKEAEGFAPAKNLKADESYDVITNYIEYLKKHSPKMKSMKIVIDAGNGTASTVAPKLFKEIGAKVTELYCTLDGRFPNHHPDPTVPANLKDLVAKVKSEKADFGIAFDGDSDRIGVVDEKGRIIFGDELMIILSRAVLKEKPGSTIISEVKSSHRLYQDIEKHGGKAIMWKTGHSLIKSKMKETHAALAGEMSGHIFFADRYFGYDDAIYAALRYYEICANHSGPASTLLSGVPEVVATPEIRVDCEEEKKFELIETTKAKLSKQYKVNDIDGVRIDFGDAWGLVRASNTQPVLVLRFEAINDKRLKEVRSIIEGALSTSAKEIGHPAMNYEQAAH